MKRSVLILLAMIGLMGCRQASTSRPTTVPPSITPPTLLESGLSSSNQNDGESILPAISGDGGRVAFLASGDLADGRGRANQNAFIHDRGSQRTELISARSGGYPVEQPVYALALSRDGRLAAYTSAAAGIVPEDDDDDCSERIEDSEGGTSTESVNCEDVFVYNRDTGVTERIPLDRPPRREIRLTLALSAAGRYLAYEMAGSLFVYDRDSGQQIDVLGVTNDQFFIDSHAAAQFADVGDLVFAAGKLADDGTGINGQVFVWDRDTGQMEQVSVSADRSQANAPSGSVDLPTASGIGSGVAISGDGRSVAFVSLATNLAAAPVNQCMSFDGYQQTCLNLYLHDRNSGQTRLIALEGLGDVVSVSLSGNGRLVVFTAVDNAYSDDGTFSCEFPIINRCGQVYLYDADTEEVTLISRAADGRPGNSGSFQAVISEDGRVVAFASEASDLIPGDTNGVSDIFLFDRETGQVSRVS